MRLLLDTCTFLWLITGDTELSPVARALIIDPENEVYLSAASAWEIAVKNRLGKLPLPRDPVLLVAEERERHRITSLAVSEAAALHTHRLPDHHRDPFDRMLVAQAIVADLTVLTPDAWIKKYPVPVHW